jgi:hypothetical protein
MSPGREKNATDPAGAVVIASGRQPSCCNAGRDEHAAKAEAHTRCIEGIETEGGRNSRGRLTEQLPASRQALLTLKRDSGQRCRKGNPEKG